MASTACLGVTISALASKAFDQYSPITTDLIGLTPNHYAIHKLQMMFHFFDGFNAAINCNGQLREIFFLIDKHEHNPKEEFLDSLWGLILKARLFVREQ